MTTLATLHLADLKRLAAEAGTSLKYLQHVLSGRRRFSVAMAVKLERAAVKLKLGPLGREKLAVECRTCPYMRACKKGNAK